MPTKHYHKIYTTTVRTCVYIMIIVIIAVIVIIIVIIVVIINTMCVGGHIVWVSDDACAYYDQNNIMLYSYVTYLCVSTCVDYNLMRFPWQNNSSDNYVGITSYTEPGSLHRWS